MAATRKLVMGFKTTDGENITLSYNHISSAITQSEITALMNGIITNGSIYAKVPASKVSASVFTTTEQDYATE